MISDATKVLKRARATRISRALRIRHDNATVVSDVLLDSANPATSDKQTEKALGRCNMCSVFRGSKEQLILHQDTCNIIASGFIKCSNTKCSTLVQSPMTICSPCNGRPFETKARFKKIALEARMGQRSLV